MKELAIIILALFSWFFGMHGGFNLDNKEAPGTTLYISILSLLGLIAITLFWR